ncbi:MAG: formate dehydrogenase subunit delta [Gammaproteobacteria bacterium]|nr:formate dehydrogenase subunit delta [Gammaproteobacteria bacterium]
MNIEHLVGMANDICDYFAAESDRDAAVAGVAGHLRKFWDPRMRTQIIAHLRSGGAGLSELARLAVQRLADDERKVA